MQVLRIGQLYFKTLFFQQFQLNCLNVVNKALTKKRFVVVKGMTAALPMNATSRWAAVPMATVGGPTRAG